MNKYASYSIAGIDYSNMLQRFDKYYEIVISIKIGIFHHGYSPNLFIFL